MIASRLEAIIAREIWKTDLAHRSPMDVRERFESLRGYRLLPYGRKKNAQHLSRAEIAAAILSISTEKPGFAGLASLTLMDLRPVGGVGASFNESGTFGEAIGAALENPDKIMEIRVSPSEIYTNSHCRAIVRYFKGNECSVASYVSKYATSALQPGAEQTFNAQDVISSVISEVVFYRRFFERLAQQLNADRMYSHLPLSVPPDDEDEQNKQEKRYASLGITRNSRFLNVAVDTQVTWPNVETAVEFEGHKLILMPSTRENTTSIHVDLQSHRRLTPIEARTLVGRFLSLLVWCDDQFAVLQDGWSGNPVPVAVPRRNLAFVTTHHWAFDRKVPRRIEARKAIAIYRDGRNAQQNYLISYAVLSYYKVIELKHKGRGDTINWFRDNYELVRGDTAMAKEVEAFLQACGREKPHEYLYRACRSAVAHANKPYSSDPDDVAELRRLHVAADILRALARLFIQKELDVSELLYDGS